MPCSICSSLHYLGSLAGVIFEQGLQLKHHHPLGPGNRIDPSHVCVLGNKATYLEEVFI